MNGIFNVRQRYPEGVFKKGREEGVRRREKIDMVRSR